MSRKTRSDYYEKGFVMITENDGVKRWAWPLSGFKFRYEMSNGEEKIVGANELQIVDGVPVTDDQRDIAEKEEPLIQFLHQLSLGGKTLTLREITNAADFFDDQDKAKLPAPAPLKEGEVKLAPISARYELSKDNKAIDNGIYAIAAGGYDFELLKWTLVAQGIRFRIRILKNKDIVEIAPDRWYRLVHEASFMFSNATNTTFIDFEGQEGDTNFNLTAMGISIMEQQKAAKRLQEICRQVEMCLFLKGDEARATLVIWEPYTPIDDPDEFYDGHNAITYSCATRLALNIKDPVRRAKQIEDIWTGKLVEVIIRIMTPKGIIKGDATLVPDDQCILPDGTQGDVAIFHTNLKKEMFTDDYTYICIIEHQPWHTATYDGQSDVTLAPALTAKRKDDDLQRMVNLIKKGVEDGTITNAFDNGEQHHDGEGVPAIEKMSGPYKDQIQMWMDAGRRTTVLGNMMYMFINGILNMMDGPKHDRGSDGLWLEKLYVLMTNATMMSVITWEWARYIGGFNMRKHNRKVSFWDPRIGYIMPGARFVETLRYHGGPDLDDQYKVLICKVWCGTVAGTTQEKILAYHLGKTVPAFEPDGITPIVIPDNPEEARDMVLVWRSPNGQGEWTVEWCEISTLPIDKDLLNDDIAVINIAEMPLPADELERRAKVNPAGLPKSTVYLDPPVPMTQAFAIEGVKVQSGDPAEAIAAYLKGNPGVGSVCNKLIAWASEYDMLPSNMLDQLEKMVDCMEQGYDKAAYIAIRKECMRLQELMAGGGMDHSVMMQRVSNKFDRKKITSYRGDFTKTYEKYVAAIAEIKLLLKEHTLKLRTASPEVQQLLTMSFSKDMDDWAKGFYAVHNKALAIANAKFNTDGIDNVFQKMTMQYNKKVAMEETVAEMVKEMNAFDPSERNVRTLALWHRICRPWNADETKDGKYWAWGASDQIMVQPGGTDKPSMLPFLITALNAYGL